nr:MAG TPA: hypothetical protein [Caudoviricetes sp.]
MQLIIGMVLKLLHYLVMMTPNLDRWLKII